MTTTSNVRASRPAPKATDVFPRFVATLKRMDADERRALLSSLMALFGFSIIDDSRQG